MHFYNYIIYNKSRNFIEKEIWKSILLKPNFITKTDSKKHQICYEYPDLSYSFYRLLRARSGYWLDARITKAVKIIDQVCPNFCPCCKSNKQWIRHRLIECPFFNHIRSKVKSMIKFYFYICFNISYLIGDYITMYSIHHTEIY